MPSALPAGLAKDLIAKILVPDPARRLKASDILRHPWMTLDDEMINDVALSGTREQLKRFQARRRLKKAIQGIRSTVRMKMLLAARTAAAVERSRVAADGGAGGGAMAAVAAGGSGLASAMLTASKLAKEREAESP